MNRIFRKYVYAQHLQSPAHTLSKLEFLIENGHQKVSAHRDPNLGPHSVLAGAVKRLDSQVLLDPFEEQFDSPARLVELGHHQGADVEVVREEDQQLARFWISETDASQARREVLAGIYPGESNGLVGPQSRGFVDLARGSHVVSQFRFRAGDKEGPGMVDASEPGEIEVAAINDVKCPGFEHDPVQGVDVVHLALGQGDKCRDGALQVDHGVQFDGRLAPLIAGPGEQRHAQVDDRSIQSVDDLIELFEVAVLGIEFARLTHQDSRQLEVGAPIPVFISVGDIGACNTTTDTHRIAQLRLRSQARFDVTQSLAKCQLREDHAQPLITSREAATASRHRILRDTTLELFPMDQIDDLRENQPACVHTGQSQQHPISLESDSNASHALSAEGSCLPYIYESMFAA